jgi:hypothetical protein
MNRSQPRPSRLRITVAVACASLGLMLATPAPASHVGEAVAADQQLVAANDRLLAALVGWQRGPAAQRAAGVAQLTQLAQQRQAQMILLLQQDPTVAAARMLPRSLRARLPEQAAAFVEQEVRVQGTVVGHVSDDFANGRSRSSFKLHGDAASAPTLEIHFADGFPAERELHGMSGKRAVFEAMRVGDHLLILDRQKVQLEAAGGTTGTGTVVAAGNVVQGNQTTLSILVNFSDKVLTCTAADVESRLFGSSGATVNNNYRESSRGLVSFSGRAVGPYPINFTSTGSCDYSAWANAANAAAKAAGFDPAQYQRVNYVTPGNSTCGWSGLAYMPGKQSWVQACGATGVYSHELGHNLSLHHASTPTAEYGDGSDPMGGARMVDHNGANRTMAGWMPAGSVQDVGSGGSYALASVSTNEAAASPQVLRIVKPDSNEHYYISLRQALNLDASLAAGYLNNLSVHRARGTLPTRTYLLANVAVGQSFTDTVNGITVSNQGIANGTATVGVVFSGGSCVRSAPTIGVSPSSQTAAPGAASAYSVTVTNRNTSYCGSSTFAMSQVLPAGFSGSFAAPNLSIAAGASASTSWSVGSSAQTAAGTYALDAKATEASFGNSATAHASQIVYVDGTAPTVSISSPANGAVVTGRVSILATASDESRVAAVEFYVDGVLVGRDTGSPYSTGWNSRKAGSGSHTIMVRALDAAGNKAEKSIVVQVK